MNYKNSYIKSSSFWIRLLGIPILIILSLFILSLNACHINHNDNSDTNEFKTEISLKGTWKFSIGDDMKWNKPDFNDNNWENIKVPSPWENEGFNGYDGYAWYRKHFNIPSNLKNKSIYLSMGYIDDCDEVYMNGHLVGFSGSFPPKFYTAYTAKRMYPCPQEFIHFNSDNVIAVRVYDDQLEGGITSGDLAVKTIEFLEADLNLEGQWKFSLGDSSAYKDKDFKDTNWEKLIVPAYWETQGHPDYDGFAWYRNSFILPDNLKNKDLLFLGGKIDDLDQVYLNGILIGSTGDMGQDLGNQWATRPVFDQEWKKFRTYKMPDSLIIPGKSNTIAIRVYDGYLNGGIYQGPVGIITNEKYTKFWREHRNK